MKKLQNGAAFIFILSVVFMAAISILGVWEILGSDVISKSGQTIGLLAVVAFVIIVAGRFIDSRHEIAPAMAGAPASGVLPAEATNPAFGIIRHVTVVVLVISLTILALLGVLAIWEVMSADVMHKSIATMGVMVFASLAIVITCLEREQSPLLKKHVSGGAIALIILLGWWFFAMML